MRDFFVDSGAIFLDKPRCILAEHSHNARVTAPKKCVLAFQLNRAYNYSAPFVKPATAYPLGKVRPDRCRSTPTSC